MSWQISRMNVAWLVVACLAVATPHALHALRAAPEPLSYPRGPWWREDLSHVRLASAHILISHALALRESNGLLVPGEPNPRDEKEALELARELRSELDDHPERFEELARKHSDDPMSASWGGHLGERHPLALPQAIVDALGNLREGQISRVVSTPLGFHILKRHSIRPEQLVAGREVRIQFVGLPAVPAVGRVPERSRGEASLLAQQTYALLQAGNLTFAQAVDQTSDGPERVQGGYLGTFSSHSMFDQQGALALLNLSPDEMTLIDDPLRGFRILQGLNPKPIRIASEEYVVGYRPIQEWDWLAESVTRTREEARTLAESLANRLSAEPAPRIA